MTESYCRPNWDEYFMEMVVVVGRRGTCDRGRCGAIITKDNHVLVTGYVGSPVGLPHCDEVGHELITVTRADGTTSQHCVRTAHAEQNAIVQAARVGVPILGSTLYVKMTPCAVCARMIINAGIVRVVCGKRYHTPKETEEMFKQAGVRLDYLSEETEKYPNQ